MRPPATIVAVVFSWLWSLRGLKPGLNDYEFDVA